MFKELICFRAWGHWFIFIVVFISWNIIWLIDRLIYLLNFKSLLDNMNGTLSAIVIYLILLLWVFTIEYLIFSFFIIIISTHYLLILFATPTRVTFKFRKSVTGELEFIIMNWSTLLRLIKIVSTKISIFGRISFVC